MSFAVEVAGRFARRALSGEPGEVCAVFRRSFYLRLPGERYACVGDHSLGCGPVNALVRELRLPVLGERLCVDAKHARSWQPEPLRASPDTDLQSLAEAAARRAPAEGFGCTIAGGENALTAHARPALDAIQAWLSGHTLGEEAGMLIGLGPGLTPSGDDYLGGVMIALGALGRDAQAGQLWRWLQPRLAGRTSAISASHLEAAAAGEAHEALHGCLSALTSANPAWGEALTRLDHVGHCSGWDGLAGATAAVRAA